MTDFQSYAGVNNENWFGGADDDRFFTYGGIDEFDDYYGGPGNDTAWFFGVSAALEFNLGTNGTLNLRNAPFTNPLDFWSIANVYSGSGDDLITGSDAANILYGGSGADLIFGGIGADTLNGGAGYDSLYGGNGADTLTGSSDGAYMNGGNGNDILNYFGGADNENGYGVDDNDTFRTYGGINADDDYYGGNGTDTAYFYGSDALIIRNDTETVNLRYGGFGTALNFQSFERVYAGSGDDDMYGGSGADTFYGNDGDDRINGGAGSDNLYGGAGDDELILNAGGGNAYGGAGADEFNLFVSYDNEDVHGGANNDRFNTYGGLDANDDYYGNSGNDSAYFYYSGALSINMDAETLNYRHGGFLFDLDFNSIENVYAGSGNDLFEGDAGNNIIHGNNGNDGVYGGAGVDTLYGGNGNDTMGGGAGADSLYGGAGFDTLYYTDSTAGVDIFLGGNTASGGYATGDTISAFENVLGSNYDDFLIGSAQVNLLDGASGDDILLGNNGNDTLRGREGRDIMYGGNQSDTFVYLSLTDSGLLFADRDRVQDFTNGQDTFDLSALDANVTAGGNQAFTYTGNFFTGSAGDLRWFESFGLTFIEGDVTGNGVADFRIELLGTGLGLDATDFVL